MASAYRVHRWASCLGSGCDVCAEARSVETPDGALLAIFGYILVGPDRTFCRFGVLREFVPAAQDLCAGQFKQRVRRFRACRALGGGTQVQGRVKGGRVARETCPGCRGGCEVEHAAVVFTVLARRGLDSLTCQADCFPCAPHGLRRVVAGIACDGLQDHPVVGLDLSQGGVVVAQQAAGPAKSLIGLCQFRCNAESARGNGIEREAPGPVRVAVPGGFDSMPGEYGRLVVVEHHAPQFSPPEQRAGQTVETPCVVSMTRNG